MIMETTYSPNEVSFHMCTAQHYENDDDDVGKKGIEKWENSFKSQMKIDSSHAYKMENIINWFV